MTFPILPKPKKCTWFWMPGLKENRILYGFRENKRTRNKMKSKKKKLLRWKKSLKKLKKLFNQKIKIKIKSKLKAKNGKKREIMFAQNKFLT